MTKTSILCASIFLSLTACTSTPVYNITNDQLEITGSQAYIWTCMPPHVQVKENEQWREVKFIAPEMSGKPYYLDGKFYPANHPHLGCDVLQCVEYTPMKKNNIMPTEIVKTGTRSPNNASVYETRPVKGELKISFGYYPNKHCNDSEKRMATFHFTR